MAICPIANSTGCEKCGMVNFCFLRSVLGNYGKEQPGQNPEEATTIESESKPPDS